MWYAIAIAVASLGMYSILAHKDRELSGRAPHRAVRAFRDTIDRAVGTLSHTLGRTTATAVRKSGAAVRTMCVAGGKVCVACCTVAYDGGVKVKRAVVRAARAASRKIAHPSSHDDSATLAQR